MSLEAITAVTTLVRFGQMLKSLGDDVNAKVNKLVESKLNAGLRALAMANNSSLPLPGILKLVEDARRFLLEAVNLEKNERLVVAYTALGTCCYILGDQSNLTAIIKSIDKIQYQKNYVKSTAKFLTSSPLPLTIAIIAAPILPHLVTASDEEVKFDDLKKKTLAYFKRLPNA